MRNQLVSYRRNQIDGAKPAQILVLLFQTAVQRARTAILCCEQSKDKERGDAVRRLLDIVIELRSTLDRSVGDIATNLDALYDFVITTVVEAHAARDAAKFQSALDVLDVLRDAFTQAAKTVEAQGNQLVPLPAVKAHTGAGPSRTAAPEAPVPARQPAGPLRMSDGGPAAVRRYGSF